MNYLFNKEEGPRMGRMLFFLVFVVALYFGMKFINQIKTFGTIGNSPKDATTVDVSGEGIAYAVPDVATVDFDVEAKGKTVAIAQDLVTARINETLDFLAKSNIAKTDIQTTNYSSNPEYSTPCPGNNPCKNPSVPQIIDYAVTQNVSVKIRDTSTSGAIVDGLGAIGVTGIDGPNFSVDNPDAVQAQAKQKAIDDARQKAVVLAGQLGVHLGKIIRFSDQSAPGPIMYDAKAMMGTAGSAVDAPSVSSLPTGQNKYVSDVVISYEIY